MLFLGLSRTSNHQQMIGSCSNIACNKKEKGTGISSFFALRSFKAYGSCCFGWFVLLHYFIHPRGCMHIFYWFKGAVKGLFQVIQFVFQLGYMLAYVLVVLVLVY